MGIDLETVYLNSPRIVQDVLINIQGYLVKRRRYNRHFHDAFSRLSKKSVSEIQKVDIPAFRLYIIAASKTPFWADRFRKYNFDINADDILNELTKLPILRKSEVRNNIELITNQLEPGPYNIVHTSGTTGSALNFPQSLLMENEQWAVWWRYRKWHGISLNQWMGWFGGRSILNIKQSSPPFWKNNYPMRQVMFSAHHLNSQTVKYYHSEIMRSKISWLHGYPSQISLLATLFRRHKLIRPPSIDIITLGAENLSATQKSIITEVFQVPIRQHYGLAEGVANISESAEGELIPDQDFAYMEFIPFTEDDGTQRKIVGTNYHNLKFPLIRYDTEDILSVEEVNDKLEILSVDGRLEDSIILPNGVRLGRLDHIFKGLVHIEEAQITQLDRINIQVKIVKGHAYDKVGHESDLIRELRKRLGNELKIAIKYVKSIDRTSSGKFRFVISKIEEKHIYE